VGLDVDPARLEADKGVRERASEHAPRLGGKPCRLSAGFPANHRTQRRLPGESPAAEHFAICH
jgi:hypothetical protein